MIRRAKPERDIDIFLRSIAGERVSDLAREHGISPSRGKQIIDKMHRMMRHPSRSGMTPEQFTKHYVLISEPIVVRPLDREIRRAEQLISQYENRLEALTRAIEAQKTNLQELKRQKSKEAIKP